MRRTPWAWGAAVAALLIAASAVVSAENKQKAFEKNWIGRHVVVKQPLYSLVYNERVRGGVKSGRDGLTVVSPFSGTYFQFDGRLHVADVMEQDIQRIVPSVKVAYQKEMMLEDGVDQVIDPVMLARYERGTELVVHSARVGLKTVRLELFLPAGTEGDNALATTLTIRWPAPLSKAFSERIDVEGLIQQFVAIRE